MTTQYFDDEELREITAALMMAGRYDISDKIDNEQELTQDDLQVLHAALFRRSASLFALAAHGTTPHLTDAILATSCADDVVQSLLDGEL